MGIRGIRPLLTIYILIALATLLPKRVIHTRLLALNGEASHSFHRQVLRSLAAGVGLRRPLDPILLLLLPLHRELGLPRHHRVALKVSAGLVVHGGDDGLAIRVRGAK